MQVQSPEGLPSLNNQLLQNLNEIEFDETMLTVPLDAEDLKKTLCHIYGLKQLNRETLKMILKEGAKFNKIIRLGNNAFELLLDALELPLDHKKSSFRFEEIKDKFNDDFDLQASYQKKNKTERKPGQHQSDIQVLSEIKSSEEHGIRKPSTPTHKDKKGSQKYFKEFSEAQDFAKAKAVEKQEEFKRIQESLDNVKDGNKDAYESNLSKLRSMVMRDLNDQDEFTGVKEFRRSVLNSRQEKDQQWIKDIEDEEVRKDHEQDGSNLKRMDSKIVETSEKELHEKKVWIANERIRFYAAAASVLVFSFVCWGILAFIVSLYDYFDYIGV